MPGRGGAALEAAARDEAHLDGIVIMRDQDAGAQFSISLHIFAVDVIARVRASIRLIARLNQAM
jgi:5,10-methylenetetrahydrofolate reductase